MERRPKAPHLHGMLIPQKPRKTHASQRQPPSHFLKRQGHRPEPEGRLASPGAGGSGYTDRRTSIRAEGGYVLRPTCSPTQPRPPSPLGDRQATNMCHMLCPGPPTPPASYSDELARERQAGEQTAQVTWSGELEAGQECRLRPLSGLGREFGEALGRGPGHYQLRATASSSPPGLWQFHGAQPPSL